VKRKKNIVIITDGMEATIKLAEKIAAELKDDQVKIRTAVDFSATDILPADICFFGCEKPNPPSFAHLETVLRHINLAGRRGGVFSPESPGAVKYLAGVVENSELLLGSQALFAAGVPAGTGSSGGGDVSGWVKGIVNQN
jgi:hypothetical protein